MQHVTRNASKSRNSVQPCSGSGLTASGLVEFANRFGAIHTHLARRYRDANDGGRPFDHADLCHLLRLAAGAEPEAPEGVR